MNLLISCAPGRGSEASSVETGAEDGNSVRESIKGSVMISRASASSFRILFPVACLLVGGCASTNNYDSAANPFDEPIAPKATTSSHASTPLASPGLASIQAPLFAKASTPGAVAYALPAGKDRALETSTGASGDSPRLQEMIDEANRIGALGDLQGKVSLLTQAGYSGSSAAFYDLARMYLDGSLPQDMQQALHFINLSHGGGYAEATRVLGMLYLRGQGVPADERYGRQLLESASKSSARAAREYGLLLLNIQRPHLNAPDLGMQYLRDAANRGDQEAALALAKELEKAGLSYDASLPVAQGLADSKASAPPLSANDALKAKALRGDSAAMLQYAQKLMIGSIRTAEPEYNAYCWLAVAEKLGNVEAGKELVFIRGVRSISDGKAPGRLDQCISDLHSQVTGQDSTRLTDLNQ